MICRSASRFFFFFWQTLHFPMHIEHIKKNRYGKIVYMTVLLNFIRFAQKTSWISVFQYRADSFIRNVVVNARSIYVKKK